MRKLLLKVELALFLFVAVGGTLATETNNELLAHIAYDDWAVKSSDTPTEATKEAMPLYSSRTDDELMMLEFIRAHEGLRTEWYICPAGQKTIGYGHSFKKGDEILGEYITEWDAEELLISDFKAALELARKDGFNGKARYGIAHFIFAMGYKTYKESTFRTLLKQNNPHWKGWLLKFDRIKGKRNKRIREQRIFELTLIEQEFAYNRLKGTYNTLENVDSTGTNQLIEH